MATAQPLRQLSHPTPAATPPSPRERGGGVRHRPLPVRGRGSGFRTLFSLIPFALFVLAAAGTLSLDSLWTQDIAPDIAPKVSPSVYDILNTTATTVLGRAQLFWMTAGFALAVWELSGAVRAVMVSLNRIYDTRDHRSVLGRFALSAWLALAAGLCVVAAAAALHLGALLVGGPLGAIARYLVAAALLWLSVGLLVRFAPAAPQTLGWVSF